MAQHPQPGLPHRAHPDVTCKAGGWPEAGSAPRPAPDSTLCTCFHSPAPMAISWVLPIGSSLDAVDQPILIGYSTSHTSVAATTTATCSTVGLPHWLAAWIHLGVPLPPPIGSPVPRARLLRRRLAPGESEAGLGAGKERGFAGARAEHYFDGWAEAGGGLPAGARGDTSLHRGLRPHHGRSGEPAGRSLARKRGLRMSPASGVLHAPCPTAAGTPQPLPALLQPAPGVPEVPGEATSTPAVRRRAPALHPRASPPPPPLRRSGGSSPPSSSSGPWDSASFSTCSSCILGHLGGRLGAGVAWVGVMLG